MKKFIFSLIAVATAMQLSAAPVDRATAQAKATAFLKAQTNTTKLAASPVSFVSERTINNSSNVTVPVYYIFNTKDRFIIVSGEDRSEEILAVGDEPLDFNNIPANMQAWLDYYQRQIEFLQARPGLVVDVQSKLNAPQRAQTVSPLLTARWDQQKPFYNQCVINGTQCLTGCPATSLAQVFYYWKYPTEETGTVPAYSYSGNYVSSLPSTTFDWANMRDFYGYWGTSGTDVQNAAVATLMRYIGQAEKMEYGANGSGISSSKTSLISDACKFFGYDSNVKSIYKQSAYGTTYYSDTQWANMIQAELEAGHPIVYCALSSSTGHAFNVDGYTSSSDKYHINWGWSGVGNGDFALNAFSYDGETFNQYQSMVIGIQPPGGVVTFPVLTVEPDSLDFGSVKTGETVTRTFNVSGINLLGDVTFATTGNVAYSVSPESLTAEEVAAGATVTVTFAPQSTGGTLTGSVTVTSSGAETKTISLTGEATVVPTLKATPNELSFNTTVGEPVTATFRLLGYNLTGAVYLSVVNQTGGFSVNKANVTKAVAVAGVDITVTYNPSVPGTHTGRVMLRSKDADTIYVELNGVATVTTYDPVMQAADENYVTQSSFRADWTDQTPEAAVASYTLQCTSDGNTTTYNDITNKYYTVENLTAGATYAYQVKAFYVDGTSSNWSNTEYVTLLAAPAFELGDVNHDGSVDIKDVTDLIDYLLGADNGVYTDCADMNGDQTVSIADVTALIDSLLGS